MSQKAEAAILAHMSHIDTAVDGIEEAAKVIVNNIDIEFQLETVRSVMKSIEQQLISLREKEKE